MATVASPPSARPARPIVRHGRSHWTVYIQTDGSTAGKSYAVSVIPDQPGFRGVWRLRAHGTETTYTVAAPKSGPAGCTCPDHETRESTCKHIMALARFGLFPVPKEARPRKAPSQAKARRAHLKTAKANVAEANALPAEARRHLAAMGPAPAPLRGTDRRAALAELPPAENLDIPAQLGIPARPARPAALPEGWVRGGSPIPAPAPKVIPPALEGSFTAGFRAAVANHLALNHGDLVECAACRYPFDPETEGSESRALCGPCLAEQKGGRP